MKERGDGRDRRERGREMQEEYMVKVGSEGRIGSERIKWNGERQRQRQADK